MPKIIPVIKAIPKITDVPVKKVEVSKVVVHSIPDVQQSNETDDKSTNVNQQLQEEKKPEKLDFFSQLKAVQLRKSNK